MSAPEQRPTLRGPLDGLVVLDLSTLIAGPGCARYCADYGATVIKIEQPGDGDTLRRVGEMDPRDGVALYFKIHNRGKSGVRIDLKSEKGKLQFLQLVDRADVLIENLRPGSMERMSLGPEVLFEHNPSLIVTRISAFGHEGPYAGRPGFATVAEAMSGFAYLNGEVDGPPLLPPVAVTDEVTALAAFSATLVALRGKGGRIVDVNLLQSMMGVMGPAIPAAAMFGRDQERLGSGLPYSVPRGVFATSDGKHVAVSGSSDAIARRILEMVGLGGRADLATTAGRLEHRTEIHDALASWVRERSREVVLEQMEKADIAVAPILAPTELIVDEHVIATGMMVDVDGVTMQGRFARLSDEPAFPGKGFEDGFTVEEVCDLLDIGASERALGD